MRMTFLLPSRAAAVALTALAAGGCAGGANPARDVVAAVGAGPKNAPTPGFVAETRPANLDYMPIANPSPERPTPARTAEEIKATEAELDALRARNEAAGAAAARLGGSPPPEPVVLPRKPNSKKTP